MLDSMLFVYVYVYFALLYVLLLLLLLLLLFNLCAGDLNMNVASMSGKMVCKPMGIWRVRSSF